MDKHAAHPSLQDDPGSDIPHLELRLQRDLHGRVHELRLLLSEDGLVLQGRTRSYYVKQLAQHAVMKATPIPIRANNIQVN